MSRTAPSDAELIRRSLDNPEVFRDVFKRHFGAVRRYTQRVVGLDAGEELAAETFLVAFERRNTFDLNVNSARPWLFGIAHNMIRHHLRAQKRRYESLKRGSVDIEPSDAIDEDALTAAWAIPYLVDAFRTMQTQDRECFLLVALGDLTYQETASVLGIPSGTVRSKIHRIRAKIRELLPDPREISDDRERASVEQIDPEDHA